MYVSKLVFDFVNVRSWLSERGLSNLLNIRAHSRQKKIKRNISKVANHVKSMLMRIRNLSVLPYSKMCLAIISDTVEFVKFFSDDSSDAEYILNEGNAVSHSTNLQFY